MTIRSMEAFVASIWDWAILDGCFGNTRIRPTDIDGLVERNGLFLLLEGKGPNVPVPLAQRILFERLRQTGLFTIVVVWGEPNSPAAMQVMTRRGQGKRKPASMADLRRIVKRWFRYADKQDEAASSGSLLA